PSATLAASRAATPNCSTALSSSSRPSPGAPGNERLPWSNTSWSRTSSLRKRDSHSSAGRNSKNGICGVTTASCAATEIEIPVFHPQGRLEEVHVIAFRRLGCPQCPLDGVEGILHVDHQRHLGTGRLTNGAHHLVDPLVRSLKPLVGVRSGECGLKLGRGEPNLARLPCPGDHRLEIGVER